MILWDVLVDGPPHGCGTPSVVQALACSPMKMFVFDTLLCIGSSRSDGSTGYHRLTPGSMLMKPGFLRSSQYVLLETHLSLWLASTTFLEDKGHISVYCKLNG